MRKYGKVKRLLDPEEPVNRFSVLAQIIYYENDSGTLRLFLRNRRSLAGRPLVNKSLYIPKTENRKGKKEKQYQYSVGEFRRAFFTAGFCGRRFFSRSFLLTQGYYLLTCVLSFPTPLQAAGRRGCPCRHLQQKYQVLCPCHLSGSPWE